MEDSDMILKLKKQLKDVEEERIRAAQYGLQLLENQTELQNQLEVQRSEMTSVIENLEQEKYTLQREVELKNRMLESLGSEYEHSKQQQQLNQDNIKEQLERNHEHEVRNLKDQWEKLKAELDEARLSEKQLKQKLDHQCELVANKSEELRMLSERASETMSMEMIDLQNEVHELETAKATLEDELKELQYRQEHLQSSNCNLTRQLERVQTEKEEREKEVVSYSRALEKAREANQELQVQLDLALRQAQDPSSKGNSLFSEVEDRRAEMERALIGMKVQHQSLQKQYAFTRQQLHRMKNQEPEVTCNDNTEEGNRDETYYVDLLKMKLESSNKEIEKIRDELSLQRMKALAESQRVLELERKLFTNERHLKLCQSENMKLRINLDELKIKYEPDEMAKLRTLKRKQEVLPVDTVSDAVAIDGVSVDENSKKLSGNVDEFFLHMRDLSENSVETCSEQCISGGASGNVLILKEDNLVTEMPVKERKRVRIVDDRSDVQALNESNRCENSKTPASPRSVTLGESKAIKCEEDGITAKRQEKKTCQKTYPVIHVPSKPTAATQCPQQ
ncbi:protein Spindly [Pleurodeles waltl]|uniref:protein Spindly n=1 Tax=Pleurodeles waltl TaxID=8319 RepID=UPI00370962FF